MPSPVAPGDRRSSGQSKRKQLPRSQHALWNPKLRQHTPVDLLRVAMRGRLPHLLNLRFQLMTASPFGFFRGAVPVMAYDLSLTPSTGITTQLCGDAHVRNLGAYAGVDGKLIFDINDFDETIRGPFEWDLKRLATSILLAGEVARAKHSVCRDAASTFLDQYRKSIRRFAEMPVLELARYAVRRLDRVDALSDLLNKAERSTPVRNLDTLTEPEQDDAPEHSKSAPSTPRHFRSQPPQIERLQGRDADQVLDALLLYRKSLQPERRHFLDQYRPLDVAFKVVGTGSVGLRDFCVYLQSNGPADALFLQIKEEAPSAYAPYLPDTHTPLHQGRRVVEGQRAMQLQSDPFLGWTTIDKRDFLVRQLNDHKGSLDIETIVPDELIGYADLCGELLARGHARAGDPLALSGYIGKSSRFDDAILHFAQAYAQQTEKDWKQLIRARHL